MIRRFLAPLPLPPAARWFPFVSRVFLGVVFLSHGDGKLEDPAAWAHRLVENRGVPAPFAWASAFVESLGGVLLLAGAATRIAAALLVCQMIGAIALVHWPNGLFGEGGYEYNLGLIVLAAGLVAFGAGPLSVDGAVARTIQSRMEPPTRKETR
ncbi:hypothetical protein BH18GEM1_BH18GEM1_17880 [soil metagenome]